MFDDEPEALALDLQAAGVDVDSVWDLVEERSTYADAIPTLIDWLEHVDERTKPGQMREQTLEGLVLALSVTEARPAATTALIALLETMIDTSESELAWKVGNAISMAGDDSVFEVIKPIVLNRAYGRSRQMIVHSLHRYTNDGVTALLLEVLDDPAVTAHALQALGRLNAVEAQPTIELYLDHERALVRSEAKGALQRLAN